MRGVQERIPSMKCDHSLFEFYHLFKGFINYLSYYDFILQSHDQTYTHMYEMRFSLL